MVALGTTRDNPDYYAIRSSTKPSAAASPRACSTTFAPSAAWPTAWAAALAPPSIIPALCGLRWDQEREHGRIHPGYGRRDRRSRQASHHRRRNQARQRLHPERVHFQSRFARQDSARTHGLRILRISPRLSGKYQAEVKKVTAADVARVAAKYLHKDQLAVLVVGNTTDSTSRCPRWVAVNNIDITIPPPAETETSLRLQLRIPRAKLSPRRLRPRWAACPNCSRLRPCA